jgi:hypothetical protein
VGKFYPEHEEIQRFIYKVTLLLRFRYSLILMKAISVIAGIVAKKPIRNRFMYPMFSTMIPLNIPNTVEKIDMNADPIA